MRITNSSKACRESVEPTLSRSTQCLRVMKAKQGRKVVKALVPLEELTKRIDSRTTVSADAKSAKKGKITSKANEAEAGEMIPSGTEHVLNIGMKKVAPKVAKRVNFKSPDKPAVVENTVVEPLGEKKTKASEGLKHHNEALVKSKAKATPAVRRKAEAKQIDLEPPVKKAKAKVQGERSLEAERKAALMAFELVDLDDLLQGDKRGSEAVTEKVAKIKDELTAKQIGDLKDMCAQKQLKLGGTKGELVLRLHDHAKEQLKQSMVQAILDFEALARKEASSQDAKARQNAQAQAAKVKEVVSKSKQDVLEQSPEELNQMLVNYGLKMGGSKEEKVERIVFAKMLAAMARDVRKQEMLSMSAGGLLDMCSMHKSILDDRLVREIMVDRLLILNDN